MVVPAGLSYRRRDRYRGRLLVQYGRPIVLGERWRARHREDPRQAARELTADLDLALRALTLNAADFDTLRVLDGVRRLYVPQSRDPSLAEEAEITRRLVQHWEDKRDVPEVRELYADVESYLALLDALGLSDWDLRRPISKLGWSLRIARHLSLLALEVPLALPGLVLHAPLLWLATRAGELVLERDDVRATLRMIAGTLVLLASHGAVGLLVLWTDPTPRGALRAFLAVAFLAISGLAAIRVLEKQAVVRHGLAVLGRILALGRDLENLRAQRDGLRQRLVAVVEAHADPSMNRIVSDEELRAG